MIPTVLQRDDELITIEKRNFFSLFCLDLEAQLVHVNLAQLAEIFEQLVTTQVKGHVDVRQVRNITVQVMMP